MTDKNETDPTLNNPESAVGPVGEIKGRKVVDAQAKADALGAVSDMALEGVVVPEEARNAVEAELEEARVEYEGHPGNNPHIENNKLLESLPTSYREAVVRNYDQVHSFTERMIEEGVLTDDYRMPEIRDMIDEIRALAPSFEAMEAADLQPAVFFGPKGLDTETWERMFQATDFTQKHTGAEINLRGFTINHGKEDIIHDGTVVEPDTQKWDVNVMSTLSKPVEAKRKRLGEAHMPESAQAKEVTEMLERLHGVSGLLFDTSIEGDQDLLFRQLSPSREATLSEQLAYAIRGEEPLDAGGQHDDYFPRPTPLSKEIEIDEKAPTLLAIAGGIKRIAGGKKDLTMDWKFGNYSSGPRTERYYRKSIDRVGAVDYIRPTVRGSDLVRSPELVTA